MKDDTWAKLEAEFAQFPILKAEPVSVQEIDTASKLVGIPFSPDYREFLQRYGGAMVGPFPILGLRKVGPMGKRWSVVDVNRWYRSQGWTNIDEWLIVSIDHSGNPMGITKDGSVWISDHDMGSIDKIAANFEDFIRSYCLGLTDA